MCTMMSPTMTVHGMTVKISMLAGQVQQVRVEKENQGLGQCLDHGVFD